MSRSRAWERAADAAWARLAAPPSSPPAPFDRSSLDGLPPPARRFLARALPAGGARGGPIVVTMEGDIRLGPRWLPFRARQVLRPGVGFVWRPVVGGRILRIEGVDVLCDGHGRTAFRLQGIVPLVRAEGTDVARSAAGRLAGETVLWAPQALVPAAGARWRALDGDRAAVTLPAGGRDVEVEVEVGPDGALRSVRLDRWDTRSTPAHLSSFGGPVTSEHVTDAGARIAGVGWGGWGWGTADGADGGFFRYRVLRCSSP